VRPDRFGFRPDAGLYFFSFSLCGPCRILSPPASGGKTFGTKATVQHFPARGKKFNPGAARAIVSPFCFTRFYQKPNHQQNDLRRKNES